MRRKHIIVLSVVLAVALVGLIGMQSNYFLTAYKLREAQFEDAVNSALTVATGEIEELDRELLEADRERHRLIIDSVQALNGTPGMLFFDSIGDGNIRVTIGGFSFTENFGGAILFDDDEIFNPQFENSLGNLSSLDAGIQYEFLFNDELSLLSIDERLREIPLQSIIKKNLVDNDITEDFEYGVRLGDRYIYLSDRFYNKPSDDGYVYKRKVFLAGAGEQSYLCLAFPSITHSVWNTVWLMLPSLLITILIICCCLFSFLEIVKEKQLSAIKNDFINNMTHELKTPIATVSLAAQMLSDDAVSLTPDRVGKISGIIRDESGRLTMLVEQVLQSALFSESRMKLKKREVYINSLVEGITEKFYLRVADRHGELFTHLDAERDEVYVDDVHITNVISNLLDNALKYCDRVPEISVYTRNSGDEIIISVVDNGIGISSKDQRMIFERFYRVSTGNRHDVKGFGLGLSYVKTIAEAHGGRVEVESQEGKGSRFDLILPLNLSSKRGSEGKEDEEKGDESMIDN